MPTPTAPILNQI